MSEPELSRTELLLLSPSRTAEITVDLSVLHDMFGTDLSSSKKFIGRYLEFSVSQLEDIERALVNGDRSTIAAAAHKLKSSSRMVGATTLGGLFEDLETLAKTDGETIEPAILERIKHLHQMVCTELKKIISP